MLLSKSNASGSEDKSQRELQLYRGKADVSINTVCTQQLLSQPGQMAFKRLAPLASESRFITEMVPAPILQ